MSTASGLVVGIGEVFGGGVAPAIAGYIAKHFGIQYIMTLGFVALTIGLIIALLLEETAPSRAASRSQQLSSDFAESGRGQS
jgi:fucose permease